jgi:hypothetical protein
MGKKKRRSTSHLDAVWLERRREVEQILERLEDRIRRDTDREERRRARLRRLTFGLLGRA